MTQMVPTHCNLLPYATMHNENCHPGVGLGHTVFIGYVC